MPGSGNGFLLALGDALVTGGSSLVSVLLMFIIGGLLVVIFWLLKDRNRLITSLGKKDDKIAEIINKYQKAQDSVTQAMAALKEVLIELRVLVGRDYD